MQTETIKPTTKQTEQDDKQAIWLAMDLGDFAESRPGLSRDDYVGARSAYITDRAEIYGDLQTVRRLVRHITNVESGMTPERIHGAARIAFAGRLTIHEPMPEHGRDERRIEYTPGQMGAVEYRAAVAAVLAQALRDNWRAHDPGCDVARRARDWFGRSIANRFFC